jgi:hypothetical protein
MRGSSESEGRATFLPVISDQGGINPVENAPNYENLERLY